MTRLIPIHSGQLAGEVVQTICARDLHAFLEVETRFDDWIRRRIEEYGFVENQDFVAGDFSSKLRKNGRGRPTIDYHLSIDMAKELAMVEKTDKGRQARRYFIDCERRAKAAAHLALGPQTPSHPAESPLLILEGELARIRANVAFFKDMAVVLNTLAFTRDADAFSRSMAGALRDIAQSSSDMLGRVAEDVGQVRGRTLAAVQTALAVGLVSPADAAARSAKAAKAARARWDKERDKKDATPKGRKGGTVH